MSIARGSPRSQTIQDTTCAESSNETSTVEMRIKRAETLVNVYQSLAERSPEKHGVANQRGFIRDVTQFR